MKIQNQVTVVNSLILHDGNSPEICELVASGSLDQRAVTGSDPIAEISAFLSGLHVRELHLIAHGSPGHIHFGNIKLGAQSLSAHSDLLKEWSVEKIILWSCYVGEHSEVVKLLEALTGAEVVATSSALGNTNYGSNWDLGPGYAGPLPFAESIATTWAHQLASFDFIQVYEVTNVADKETNLHVFDTAEALGSASISDNENSYLFSGNDISAIAIDIGGETFYGWVSRPIKDQGKVVAFYMWTDADFSSLQDAVADGNQDGDSDPSDNRGFILVVNQARFEAAWTALPGGSLAEIGSSSDRVDNALNSLLPVNTTPLANPDQSDLGIPPGVPNGPAREEGAQVAGKDARGNVLDNDVDPDAGDFITVVNIGASGADMTVAPGTSSASGTEIQGSYGTLTIGADGSYLYSPDDTNPDVQALRLTSNTLSDSFTYQIADSGGATAISSLTIIILGANDAPIAANDYNFAKEALSAEGGTGVDPRERIAVGSVLDNDTDVDQYGETLEVKGLIGSATIDSFTSTPDFPVLIFDADSQGFNGVQLGRSLFINIDGVYCAVLDSSGNNITMVSKAAEGTPTIWMIGLSENPVAYWSEAQQAYIPFTDLADAFFTQFPEVGFVNSSSLTTEVNNGAMKTATVSNTQLQGETELLLTVGSASGSIAIGMNVSGDGVPSGAQVIDVTYDGAGNPVSVTIDKIIKQGTLVDELSFTGGAGATITGAFGTLVLESNGDYVYTPFEDGPLGEGEVGYDDFEYCIVDLEGETSSAILRITVYGSSLNDPIATDDVANGADSALEEGVAAGANASGNVLLNDDDAAGNPVTQDFLRVVGFRAADDSSESSVGSTLDGRYGSLTLNSDGTWIYEPDDANPDVDALNSTQSLEDAFFYRIDSTQAGSSGFSIASLTVTIQGANDAPVARDDVVAAQEDVLDPTGEVLSNDTDVDNEDSRTVTQAQAGSSTIFSAGTEDDVPAGSSAASGLVIDGSYGTLTIGSDGSYSYSVNNADPQIQALDSADAPLEDVFTYEISDSEGALDTARLTVSVYGTNDVPINSTPASLTALSGESLSISGVNQISVSDIDDNLETVSISVEHGTLNLSTSGGATIVNGASGSRALTLSGTLTQINNALATLSYTSDAGFAGTDYLTVFSLDQENAFDNDVVPIFVGSGILVTAFGPVNEASDWAMFCVDADEGESLTLTLGTTSTSSDDDATLTGIDLIQYSYNGSTWYVYGDNTNGDSSATDGKPLVTGSGKVYVRVDITSEQDDEYEVEETFTLSASLVSDDSITSTATNSIVDSGDGTIYDGTVDPGTDEPGTDDQTPLDDDRTISVVAFGPVNEASEWAMFCVAADEDQLLILSLGSTPTTNDADATLIGSNLIEYSYDGSTWYVYGVNGNGDSRASSGRPLVTESGKVYVRVDITSEQDDEYEIEETFTFSASYASNDSNSDTATNSIVDGGNGTIYDGTVDPETDVPGEDDQTPLDDDRTVSITAFGPVNEASDWAMFCVDAIEGESLTLTLGNTATTSDVDATLTGTNLIQYSYDGATWFVYGDNANGDATATDGKPLVTGSGKVYVRVDITSEQDDEYEGAETFTLSASFVSDNSKNDTATNTILDNGDGTIYDGTVDPETDQPGEDNETPLDDDRIIAVTAFSPVNEASNWAMFCVDAMEEISLTLSLGSTPTTEDVDATLTGSNLIEYSYDGSTWYVYGDNANGDSSSSDGKPLVTESGKVYVRVDISSEQDDDYEGGETFTLTASSASDSAINDTAISTIVDDGTGTIFDGTVDPETDQPGEDEQTPLDDDRVMNPVSVIAFGPVNEGSDWAMFCVETDAGESLTLTLGNTLATNDVDATLTGSDLIEYSYDGSTWYVYGDTANGDSSSADGKPLVAESGKVYVRVNITSEQDDEYEDEETFTLTATLVSDETNSGTATNTIVDEGDGTIYDGAVDPETDQPIEDDESPLDDDTYFNAKLDPESDTGILDGITKEIEPSFLITTNLLEPGCRIELLDSGGQVIATVDVEEADLAAEAIRIQPGTLDDGVYDYTARLICVDGTVKAQAPVSVTVVTDLDGVAPSIENAANQGDFNNDGIPDYLQNGLAHLPLASVSQFQLGQYAQESSFGALLVGDLDADGLGAVELDVNAQLSDIAVITTPALLPDGFRLAGPVIRFSVTSTADGSLADVAPGVPGLQVRVVVDLPSGSYANTFLKYDESSGQWIEYLDDQNLETYDDGATLIDTDGDSLVDRVVLTITDGGVGDIDGIVNGFITDPGALAYKESSTPVYVVKLDNGDLYYTSDPADAQLMSEGTENLFMGSFFDNMIEDDDSVRFFAFNNYITDDWYFAEDINDMPYACYLDTNKPGFFINLPDPETEDGFHLYLNAVGVTYLVTQEQADSLQLLSQGFVDYGIKFTATTESAFIFDPEGFLIANQNSTSIQNLVADLAAQYTSTSDSGFIEAVEQFYLNEIQIVGVPNGSNGDASATDLNAIFGTNFGI